MPEIDFVASSIICCAKRSASRFACQPLCGPLGASQAVVE